MTSWSTGWSMSAFPALPDMRPRTILLGGFSKDYAMTGWRVGFAAAPAEILQGLLRIHQYTVMCAPTTSQMAALKALEVGAPFVAEMQAEYDRRRRLIVDAFNEFGMPTFEPRGAFYAFPKITIPNMDDNAFAIGAAQGREGCRGTGFSIWARR